MRLRLYAILVTTGILNACSSMPGPVAPQPAAPHPAAAAECIEWLQRLDAAIDAAGVRDAEAHRLPGYPHLRSNRLLASFADEASRNSAAYQDWLQAMHQQDRLARDIEISNLPAAAVGPLRVAEKDTLRDHITRCGKSLMARDAGHLQAPREMNAAARVPDRYSTALRALGLYPLVSIPFLEGVQRWQQRASGEFERRRVLPSNVAGANRYLPPAANSHAEDPRRILASVRRDTLGIPNFTDAERESLVAAFAPVFEIDIRSGDDQLGAVAWKAEAGGHQPVVDTTQPTVYHRIAFTRFEKEVLTQLAYTAWFPRRTSSGAFDLLAGELDGVVVRITLDGEGRPLMADSIHACGCYHEFFPGPRMTARPAPDPHLEWAFSPAPLPALNPGARLAWRLAAGTHYLTGIGTTESTEGIRYALADESRLRTLSLSAHATRSLYGPDGLIAGSERGERFLFWPMGIASAGAMRQWGGHATAFVGRRHFDDADLIEKRFALTRE